MHATAVTASQSMPAGQLSVRTMASCYNCCAHSRVHSRGKRSVVRPRNVTQQPVAPSAGRSAHVEPPWVVEPRARTDWMRPEPLIMPTKRGGAGRCSAEKARTASAVSDSRFDVTRSSAAAAAAAPFILAALHLPVATRRRLLLAT